MKYDGARIHPTARIARNATVVGDVVLGAECTVLFNATIRGDYGGRIIVGDRTNIQELACLHVPIVGDTVVGSDVTIGHGAIVHGCTIGDRTLIGMGSILIDGARIGNDCLVGAGALVTGSANIPDGMLVLGSPARAVRPLTEEEITYLRTSAEEYLEVGADLVNEGLLVEGFAPNGN